MQRVADSIVAMAGRRGIACKIYLDDVIVIAPDKETCAKHFNTVRDILAELGLPESVDKIQPPSTSVTWLGIMIDSLRMTLSIPNEKLQEILTCVTKAIKCRTISQKHLRSILGKLLHIAKCIRPARLFVARLLEALRSMTRTYIKVDKEMRKDFSWFIVFASAWNGTSLIPNKTPDRVIQVDASCSGIGAHDGRFAYGGRITPLSDPVANINELEGVNVVVAVSTFMSLADRGSHVLLQCDNLASVEIFRHGRGRNRVLLECARHLWMLQSILDIRITYEHIAGNLNTVADSLSRLHVNEKYEHCAFSYIEDNNLSYIEPCLYVFSALYPLLLSRAGIRVAPTKGCQETTVGESTGHA